MQHAFADINGIRMHYVTDGAGEPLLFLHDFPEYWGVWKKYLAEFSKNYRVIAPDLRGYNQTSRPKGVENYRIQHLAGDIKGLADHLGLKKLTIVAQGWGAITAWNFALRHPEYIQRFITVNITHPALFNRDLRENPQQQQASQYMLLFRSPESTAMFEANDYAMAKQTTPDEIRKQPGALSDEDYAEWVQSWKQPGSFDAFFNYYRAAQIGPPAGPGNPGGSNLLDDIPQEKWKVNFPVLVLFGEKSPFLLDTGLVGLEQYVSDLTIKKIPDATHWVTMQQPALVMQHIRDFLSRKGKS